MAASEALGTWGPEEAGRKWTFCTVYLLELLDYDFLFCFNMGWYYL